MPVLRLDSAEIHYETFGAGPLLLLIPGANGRGASFHAGAQVLGEKHTVVCWDRRGFSGSHWTGPQEFDSRLDRDADDAAALIEHLSAPGSSGTAAIFGTSSGAIVATKTLVRHPNRVHRLLIHEPPFLSLLPEEFLQKAQGLVERTYAIHRSQGPVAALDFFISFTFEGEDQEIMRSECNPAGGDEKRANILLWLEFELRQYPFSDPGMEILQREKAKVFPLVGSATPRGPGLGPISAIAGTLGRELSQITDGHFGYVSNPQGWAKDLLALLEVES